MTYPEDYAVEEIKTSRHSAVTIVAVSIIMIAAASLSLFVLG